ncbi:MAG: DegV family protein [Acidothermus sp.]|nr:DegV family protein [Acidothermus sp.]
MSVVLVTDSAAALPEGIEAGGLVVVPLQVVADGVAYRDGIDLTPADAADLLRRGVRLTTSRPSPAIFARIYQSLLHSEAGDSRPRGIVSVHLSGKLSGTVEAARLAARELDAAIRVVDSQSVGMGLGFAVLAGLSAAADGADVDTVEAVVRAAARETSVFFVVDSLEYLRRGGRLAIFPAVVGTALAVKPLLAVDDGRLVVVDRPHTMTRALRRLTDVAVEYAGDGPVAIAVHHFAARGRAERLAGELDLGIPRLEELYVTEIGPVVGAHTGPGMVGVAVHRKLSRPVR